MKLALCPKVARLREDMLEFAEEPRDLVILDENGKPLTAGDTERRFFEASWMHMYNGKYYFSYSTGDTHLICYATGDNPYGPFTYQGCNPYPPWWGGLPTTPSWNSRANGTCSTTTPFRPEGKRGFGA